MSLTPNGPKTPDVSTPGTYADPNPNKGMRDEMDQKKDPNTNTDERV